MELNLREELENIIQKLEALGEDEKELKYWLTIFDDLTAEEQEELMKNLRSSLVELSDVALEKSA